MSEQAVLLLLLLRQVHPGSSQLACDDDGLLPEWLIYHEFVATSRPFLRQVSRPSWALSGTGLQGEALRL